MFLFSLAKGCNMFSGVGGGVCLLKNKDQQKFTEKRCFPSKFLPQLHAIFHLKCF